MYTSPTQIRPCFAGPATRQCWSLRPIHAPVTRHRPEWCGSLAPFVRTGRAVPALANAISPDRPLCGNSILSDIRMPKLGGIDLASRLISGGYRTPIILMSAGHTDRVGVSAAFIRKAFAFDHLLTIIARALDSPIPHWVDATA